MAANDDSDSKCRFDYISYGFIADICEKTALDFGSDDPLSFSKTVTVFLEKFHLTDAVLFRKAGKSGSNSTSKSESDLSGVLEALFNHSNSVRCYRGVEIEVENEKTLFSMIQKERSQADFLTVRSADEKVIRAAADSPDVDVVIPVLSGASKPAAGKINHIVAKIAADKKTSFGFDITPFLSVKGYRRSKLFADVSEMIPILRKYKVPILLFSGAESVYELRGSYELEAFGRLLGLTREEASQAVQKSGRLIQMRQKQMSGAQIMPGVEIITDGQDESES